MHEAAAAYALGDREEAVRLLGVLEQRLASARERREDLFPDPRANAKEPSEGGGAQAIERIALEALVHVWRALLELEARGLGAGVLEELRAAHVLFLEARVVALRTGASDPATLDALLAHDLSPHALVLFNERLAPERRGPALERAVMLAEGWGRAAPLELQGLGGEGAAERQIGDVFLDPRRLALLKEMRAAEHQDLQRQLDELDELDQVLLAPDGPEARANLERRIFHRHYVLRTAESDERKALDGHDPATLTSAELRAVHAQLLEYLTPSMHAHTLAGALRAEGRSREARELCERALSTLRTAPLASGTWSELSSARFELLRGSALMDEDRPREAEQALLEGERRLSAIEKRMEEWRRSALDPDAARQYEAQVRSLRGEALLSLAVNANVRQGDPAKALEYFERAFELNQSPFMRVLRACYRARSGRAEEARTVLASVVPVPSLYYNIACTYALLGEREQALDYLARDLRENHPSPGSLAQKRDWARGDPDLASLRGEPRFERLLGSD
jgi:tetratricopeptide (TPR) repeat protein